MKGFLNLLKKIGIVILLLAIAVFVFLNLANYSEGYRHGIPIKISKRGVIFKTHEGTMNLGGITNSGEGAIPTTWDFTVRKKADSVLTKIDQAIEGNHTVKVFYEEKYVKFFWLGDTKYFVYDVEVQGSDN